MFNKSTQITPTTWKTVQSNALFLFFAMVIPTEIDNSPLLLLGQGVILFSTGGMPLVIPRIPVSASIACGIVMALGCGIATFSLAPWFPALKTVIISNWGQWVPSVSFSLAVVLWAFVVLKISPISRALLISTAFVAAAAGYSLACGVHAIVDAIVSDVTRTFKLWEEGIAYLLNGCAMVVWARLVTRKLAGPGEKATLFLGYLSMGIGIFAILWHIFS